MESRNRHSKLRNLARQEGEIPYPVEKTCSTCKMKKNAEDFGKAKAEVDGLRSQCKSCVAVARKAWYAKNVERQVKAAADWQKANPEKVKESRKRTYYKNHASRRARCKTAYEANKAEILAESRKKYAEDQAHREKMKARSLKYYEGNASGRVAYQMKYKTENPENTTIWANNRRTRKKNAPGECTRQEWADRLEEFNYCCAYCLQHESLVGKLSVDHMTSLSQGGTSDIDNLVPACRPCNSSKNGKTLLEFLSFKWKKQHI